MTKKKKPRVSNAVEPVGQSDFARILSDDRYRTDWNFLHLARQEVALRDEGKADSVLAIYIRRAMNAILTGNDTKYHASLDEIIKICEGL